jgi:hypothetical protein
VAADVIRRGGRTGAGGGDRLLRVLRPIQLDQHDAEADVRERELRVDLERRVERPRCFDPDGAVQIRQALVVQRLRLFRRRGGVVMCPPNPGAQGDRPFEDFERDRRQAV